MFRLGPALSSGGDDRWVAVLLSRFLIRHRRRRAILRFQLDIIWQIVAIPRQHPVRFPGTPNLSGESITPGYLAFKGIEEEIQDSHFAAGQVDVGAVENQLPVNSGGGKQKTTRTASRIINSCAVGDISRDNRVGCQVAEGLRRKKLAGTGTGQVLAKEVGKRVLETVAISVSNVPHR